MYAFPILPSSMKNYHDLMQYILDHGTDQYNTRTGKTCRVVVGAQLTYDLTYGFPAITTKKLAFNSVRGELLGFFRGYTNAADFRKLGCSIWDANANQTQAWLENPYRKGKDDLGRIYGAQWTDWRDKRVFDNQEQQERFDELSNLGYQVITDDRYMGRCVVERKINQLERALSMLLTDPSDRRIIVSGWNPGELDLMALPPCHMDYRFVAFENPKVLHVVMTQRSADMFLGIPFNIASTSLFLAVMARLSGFVPGTVTLQLTNAHIYEDHFDQVREQLTRNHFDAPSLILSENIKPVSCTAEIAGAFTRIEPQDIYLSGYESHASIKAPMAA